MKLLNLIIACALVLVLLIPAQAVTPDEILDDPILEERARELSAKLRCLVCQNQSIDDSDAPLAKDLRILVRQKLIEGNSNNEVLDFVVSKYGEFVLLQPKFGSHTLVLWTLPPIIFLAGIFTVILIFHRNHKTRQDSTEPSLTTEEESKLIQIIGNNPPNA